MSLSGISIARAFLFYLFLLHHKPNQGLQSCTQESQQVLSLWLCKKTMPRACSLLMVSGSKEKQQLISGKKREAEETR